ncbi:MAG TPA: monofunctional biosynthetic peptidoglycan transglycosylase [Salinimicrobium sp.]|nr:monofunctional biosynthetic peptidoglycan transglycosylase [Salinimicrobium sp.]
MKRFFRFIFKTIIYFLVFSVLWVLLYKWVPVPYTPLMAIRAMENEAPPQFQHDWVSMDQISPNLQLAVIASEDQKFLTHNGFDVEAIEKAIESNKKSNKTRGASTISQQTAKNVFLWPQRSWLRKGFEVYFTFLIELFWDKERILEVYLNSIEMGDGIYGAEAAAQFWFKKSAADLSSSEAASIAAILPNPREYKANPASNYIANRKNWIIRQMRNLSPLKFE